MSAQTLVIAEMGSSHDNDISKAKRLIDAAKACGANVVKGQWTSNGFALARRRGLGADAAALYVKYLQKPISWVEELKAHCDSVGIEWACTVYLIEDIATIAPLVKRFKVSAFEAGWDKFVDAHGHDREIIVSMNPGHCLALMPKRRYLHCISKYPTPVEELKLINCRQLDEGPNLDGLSDHTASTLTGALAVAAGATIVEKHIRLHDTKPTNPDYGHSLIANKYTYQEEHGGDEPWEMTTQGEFKQYVANIREAEKAL